MLKLNHLNLTVGDVPAVCNFFEQCSAFKVTERRGTGKFAVLEGKDGFALILMHGKDETELRYPDLFHIGFLVSDESQVHATWEQMAAAGYEPPKPEILKRGGDKTYGFYHPIPGGVLVEVSAPAASGQQL